MQFSPISSSLRGASLGRIGRFGRVMPCWRPGQRCPESKVHPCRSFRRHLKIIGRGRSFLSKQCRYHSNREMMINHDKLKIIMTCSTFPLFSLQCSETNMFFFIFVVNPPALDVQLMVQAGSSLSSPRMRKLSDEVNHGKPDHKPPNWALKKHVQKCSENLHVRYW